MNVGNLFEEEFGQVVLQHKSNWGFVSRYQYGEEQIRLKTKSNHSAVARSDRGRLFYLAYPWCARDKPWCTAVVADHVPQSIVLAIVLYEGYSS